MPERDTPPIGPAEGQEMAVRRGVVVRAGRVSVGFKAKGMANQGLAPRLGWSVGKPAFD